MTRTEVWGALLQQARIPGMSVALIEDGEIVGVELFGVASAESGEPVDSETLFEAASLSKPVFATIVLKMVERGELDLDQPLQELRSDDRVDHDTRWSEATARMVLSHTTGLPNWGGERLDLEFEPGTKFRYSGEGYVFLQKVVEEMTGLGLDELARREVFEPLGMKHSRFSWAEGESPSLATGHDMVGRPQPKETPSEGNAASSLHTTAEDYARFLLAWLDPGRESVQVPSQEAVREALSVQVRREVPEAEEGIAEADPVLQAWGLGWGLQRMPEVGGEAINWHWGDNGAFKAFAAINVSQGSGVAYFTNSTNGLVIGNAMVADVVGDMAPTFDLLGYGSSDDPGWVSTVTGIVAQSEGRLTDAIASFEEAFSLAPDDEELERRLAWAKDLARVQDRPVVLSPEVRASYAGDYGPRHMTLEEGVLVYQRIDGDRVGARYRLIPVSDVDFAAEGLDFARFEVGLDDTGKPVRLMGHYLDGSSDDAPRSSD